MGNGQAYNDPAKAYELAWALQQDPSRGEAGNLLGRQGEAQPQYSLNAFPDGTRFVDVQTDQVQFNGLSEKEESNLAKKIIKDKFAGKVVGIDNPVFVNGRSAAEYGYPVKSISGTIRDSKARASTELDNLIDAGTNFRTAPDGADGHIHPKATGGFSYFDTIFKIGNEYYKGVINIQNNEKGRLFKDITKIENITQDISSSYGKNPKSTFLRDNSINIIPTSTENVNGKSNLSLQDLDPAELTRILQQKGLSQGMIENLLGNQGETAPKAQAQLQYSIQELPNGKKYVEVDTDQHLFDGLSTEEMQNAAKKVILQKFRNTVIGSDYTAYVNKRSAEHYAYPANRRMSEVQKQDKMRTSTELDNIMEASVFLENVPDDGRHPNAVGGIDKLKTQFHVNGRMYSAEISVLVTDKGRVFYDLTKFKDITGSKIDLAQNAAETTNNVLNKISIAQPGFNDKYTQESSFDSGKPDLSLRGLDPVTAGEIQRQMAGVKTDFEKSVIRWGVSPEKANAVSGLRGNVEVVFDGTLRDNENGYYQDGVIHLNPNLSSEQAILTTYGHELTHALENTGSYRELANLVLNGIGNKTAIQNAVNEKIELYRKNGVELDRAGAVYELVADFAAERLFTDEQTVRRLVREKPGLAKRILSWIREQLAKLTNDTAKAELLRAERLYSRMINEAGNSEGENVRYSLSGKEFSEDKYFARQVDRWSKLGDGARVKVGIVRKGSALQQIGLPAAGMYFDIGKIRKSMSNHGDHLTAEVLKGIPDLLNDPIVITEYTGPDGKVKNTVNVYGNLFANGHPVVVGVVMHLDSTGQNVINNIRTIHARSNFAKQITDSSVLYLNENKRKVRSWFQVCGNLNVPLDGIKYGLIRSIAFDSGEVNRSAKEKAQLSLSGSVDGAQLSIYRNKYLYDIVDIKENTTAKLSLMKKGARSAAQRVATWGDVYNNSVSNSPGNVNGRKYLFAGEKAQKADLEMLAKAKEMEAQGESARDIRIETGWLRGIDGKWRFETDDSAAVLLRTINELVFKEREQAGDELLEAKGRILDDPKLTDKEYESFHIYDQQKAGPEEMKRLESELLSGRLRKEFEDYLKANARYENLKKKDKLRDYLDHAELYAQYPELKNLPVNYYYFTDGSTGMFMEDEIGLSVSIRRLPEEVKKTLLHEIQHAIQEKEGFSGGASPEYWKEVQSGRNPIRDEEGNLRDAFELYENTAGEIEARTVENRMDLTREERRHLVSYLGDKHTVFADEDISDYAREANSIKEQLREHQEELNKMEPVSYVIAPATLSVMNKSQVMGWVESELRKTGFRVERQGFGTISFTQESLTNALRYFSKGDVEVAAYPAIPAVLKRGIIIETHENHKERGYGTITIAAPVSINGSVGNMAVVVKQTKGNAYKTHRLLTPGGDLFGLSGNDIAGRRRSVVSPKMSSLRRDGSDYHTLHFNTSIPTSIEKVKPKKHLPKDPFLADRLGITGDVEDDPIYQAYEREYRKNCKLKLEKLLGVDQVSDSLIDSYLEFAAEEKRRAYIDYLQNMRWVEPSTDVKGDPELAEMARFLRQRGLSQGRLANTTQNSIINFSRGNMYRKSRDGKVEPMPKSNSKKL